MLGVMLILCNGQCQQLFRVYYFRALCAVTEGASSDFVSIKYYLQFEIDREIF
jgi:hypothetical protein